MASIRGVVRMAPAGVPVAGASVEVLLRDGTRRRGLTGADGSFDLGVRGMGPRANLVFANCPSCPRATLNPLKGA